jgi:hypothetical protein
MTKASGILLNNRILAAAEQKVEIQLTPQNRAHYLKVVNAGMQAALAKGPNGILASLLKSKDPIHDSVVGAINLCLLLRKQSRDTMPLKAMVPAAMTLMLKALDFAEKNGMVKIGTAELVQASHLFADTMFQRMGVSPQMLKTAASRVHTITQDPAQLEQIKREAGEVKHPLASDPTPGVGNVPH